MAQLIQRLGKGKWKIFHNGEAYVRILQRKVNRKGGIDRWVVINGKKVQVK